MWQQIFNIMRNYFGDNQRYDGYKITVRIWMMGLILVPFAFLLFYTSSAIQEEDRFIVNVLVWPLVFMSLLWYYRTSYTQPVEIPQPNTIPDDQYCEKWNLWKPMRARHWRIWERCVTKMDHHCPWTANWIGYHNLKFFFLFKVYAWLAATIYIESTIRFSFITKGSSHMNGFARLGYWITNFFVYLWYLLTLNLIINEAIMIYNNITTIENYSGVEVNCPFVNRTLEKNDNIEVTRNIYDRLWVNNFWDVFGDSFWKWLLPIGSRMEGDGFYYPRIPDFEMSDLRHTIESKNVEQTFEMHDGRESADRYAKNALFKLKGSLIVADSNLFVIPENQTDVPANMHDDYDSD